MPKQYEEIRDSYLERGEDEKDAKRKAAMTFIAKGKGGTRSSRAKSLHSGDTKRRKPPTRFKSVDTDNDGD